MGLIVGEAEVLITANATGLEGELAASSDPAFGKLKDDAGAAGEDAGMALSGNLHDATKDIGDDLEDTAKDAGGRFSGGMESALSGLKGMLTNLGIPEALLGPEALGVAGLAAVGAAAVDLGEKMQSADAAIATSAGITVKAATNIGNAMLNTAGQVEFSGIEQAKAFASVAGQLKSTEGQALNTAQSMQFMKAAMDLATATGTDLNTTVATVASTMQAFQLPVKQAASVTDILFNSANATGQSIDTVGAALDKVKSKMGATSPPISDLSALLVDLTNHGETGRAAMTALGTAFTGLIPPTGKLTAAQQQVKDAQEKLGVSFINSKTGALDPISQIIAELAPKVQGLSNAQGIALLTSLGFGSASSKLLATIQAGPKAFTDSYNAVTKHNSAQDAADVKSKTLAVTFKTLEATVENFGTKLGEELIPVITEVVGVLKILVPIIGDTLNLALKLLEPILNIIISQLKIVIGSFGDLVDFVTDVFEGKWSAAFGAIEGIFKSVFDYILDGPEKVIDLFGDLPGEIVSALGNFVSDVFGVVTGAPEWIYQNAILPVIDLFLSLPMKIVDGYGDVLGIIFKGFLGAGEWIDSHVIIPVVSWFEGLPGKIIGAIGSGLTILADWGEDIVKGLAGAITDSASLVWKAIEDIFKDGISPIKTVVNSIPVIGSLAKAIGFATGGYVTSPTLAVVGEAGPEYIIPESMLNDQKSQVTPLSSAPTTSTAAAAIPATNPVGAAAPMIGGDVNISVTQASLTPEQLMTELGWALKTGALVGV